MLTFRLALDEQTSRSEANAHGRHDVTRCDHKAVSTRQAGCEKPIVEQIGGVERKAPTVPVNLGKRIYGRARRRDDRIERAGGNGRIDPIRIKGAGRFALAAINNAGSQAQLRLVRQAEGLGRPYRRNVAWHIVEAAVHLRAELIITVVGQQLEITRHSVPRLALDPFGCKLSSEGGRGRKEWV